MWTPSTVQLPARVTAAGRTARPEPPPAPPQPAMPTPRTAHPARAAHPISPRLLPSAETVGPGVRSGNQATADGRRQCSGPDTSGPVVPTVSGDGARPGRHQRVPLPALAERAVPGRPQI